MVELVDHWSNNWRRFRKNHFYHFYLSQLFSFGQLWNSPVTCRYFKNVFYKSPDNNDPRANSRSMSKFVTIANWQICCFIAKFPINLQFWYKLLGLSWGQSLHQNCKDVKLHITCLIPGLAFISPAIFFTWHNPTCVHWHWHQRTRAHTAHHQICHLSLMGLRST